MVKQTKLKSGVALVLRDFSKPHALESYVITIWTCFHLNGHSEIQNDHLAKHNK